MVLFFPLFRISPLYCGAASSISFCSATPVLLAAFVVLSICFSCSAGCKRIQATSWILLLFNIDTEWWKVNCNTVFHFPHSDTLLQPVRSSLPFPSSVSNFCLRCYATRLPAAASQHMGTGVCWWEMADETPPFHPFIWYSREVTSRSASGLPGGMW